MELSCAESFSSSNTTEADIEKAFEDDAGRGEFIILSQSAQVYIQAAGEANGPYSLEYRQGNKEQHFECTEDLTKAQVQSVFLKYLKDDTSWQRDYQWKKLELKPWWKFW